MKTRIMVWVGVVVAALVFVGCSAEARKARRFDRAAKLFAAGDYEQAKIEYTNLLRDDPESTIVNERLALIWSEVGAPFRALPFLVRMRANLPENYVLRTKLAAALMAAGRIDEARGEALAVVQGTHAHEDALLILAQAVRSRADYDIASEEIRKSPARNTAFGRVAQAHLLLLKGEPDEAQRVLTAALEIDARCSAAHSTLAALQLRRGNRAGAADELKHAAELAPPRSPARIKYAEFLAQSGSRTEAIAWLEAMLRETPDFLTPRTALARLLIQENKLTEAEAALTALFYRDPASVDGHILQAHILAARKNPAAAVDRLEALEKANPGLAVVTYSLAQMLLHTGKAARAIEVLRDGVGRNPDHIESIVLLADLYLKTGRPEATVQGMAQLLVRYPQFVPAQTLLISGLRALGRLDEAIAVAREQVRVLRATPEPGVLLGGLLLQQGKVTEAREAYESALAIAPQFHPALAALVDLELRQGNAERALARVRTQAEAGPSADLFVLEATIHLATRQWERAEAALQSALDANPNHERAYALLASSYALSRRGAEALHQLAGVLAANPSNTRALALTALLQTEMRDFAAAKEAYERLLAVQPASALALNNLAYLLVEKFRDVDRACTLASDARERDPASPLIADTLGWILLQRQEHPRALELIQEAASKLPDNPEIQYHLGVAHAALGHRQLARAAFDRAAAAPTDFSGKAEIAQRIRLLERDDGPSADHGGGLESRAP